MRQSNSITVSHKWNGIRVVTQANTYSMKKNPSYDLSSRTTEDITLHEHSSSIVFVIVRNQVFFVHFRKINNRKVLCIRFKIEQRQFKPIRRERRLNDIKNLVA